MNANGRAVLVTGGSRGIGAAVARAFPDGCHRLAGHYGRNPVLAEYYAASLPGSGHVVVGADLRDPDAVRAMVDAAAEGLGGIDVLVNNAGIFEPHPIAETTYEEWQAGWRDTLGVNLVGAANVTWCAVQHMLRGGRGGRIVNVSSRGAFRGGPGQPAYGAAKAGLVPLRPAPPPDPGPPRRPGGAGAPGLPPTDPARAAPRRRR